MPSLTETLKQRHLGAAYALQQWADAELRNGSARAEVAFRSFLNAATEADRGNGYALDWAPLPPEIKDILAAERECAMAAVRAAGARRHRGWGRGRLRNRRELIGEETEALAALGAAKGRLLAALVGERAGASEWEVIAGPAGRAGAAA